jgi:pilus assembly protein CpaB
MLAVRDWPEQLVPPGALSDPQDAVGRVASSAISTGEVVLVAKITGEISKVGVAAILPPGLVAIVLSLPPVSAAAGNLHDGDTVDVLLSLDYAVYDETGDQSKSQYTTFYTIQDVRVVSVGGGEASPTPDSSASTGTGPSATARSGQSVATGPLLVTLMVTPQDALILKYARERGTVDLVLRSPNFHDLVETDPVYLDYIMRRFDLPRPVIIHQSTTTGAGQ